MKIFLIVLGVVFDLVGTLWILQGTNVLTQGQMAGDTKWLVIGIIVAAVGAILIVAGATRRGRPDAARPA